MQIARNVKFTKYQCSKKRNNYFLELTIIVAFIIVSSLSNYQYFPGSVECNSIPISTKAEFNNISNFAESNSNNNQFDKTKLNTDFVTSSSNERKPTRLDANENELVQIEELSVGPSSNSHSLDLPRQHTANEQQITSPHVDRILNAETFQANDLVNLLDLQQEHHENHNQKQKQQQKQNQQNQFQNDDSFGDFLNANAKRRARSIESDVGYEGNGNFGNSGISESDISDFIPDNNVQNNDENAEFDQEQQDNNDALPLASSSMIDPSQSEREAQASSQADFVNRLAMEDQQRKQNEMQTAQAQHVAKAIEDQQAALTRQHDILMKQQLDEALNDSVNDRAWRRSLTGGSSRRDEAESSSASTRRGLASNPSDTIYFSDHLDNSSPNTSGFQLGESNSIRSVNSNPGSANEHDDGDYEDDFSPAEASNNDESYDLAPAAQHHSYGAHYGALHKHQGKYYQ